LIAHLARAKHGSSAARTPVFGGPLGGYHENSVYWLSRRIAMSSEIAKPTLYDRLGGVYSIAAVVDDFIDRVMHNPVLNANAAVGEAHHRVSAAGFKYYVTEMVCWATGGPQNYTGRSMSESHKHLKITESEWAAFCKDFDDTMAKFNVPEAEHKELFAIVESTKGDIVTG
jgi:hemoglobin